MRDSEVTTLTLTLASRGGVYRQMCCVLSAEDAIAHRGVDLSYGILIPGIPICGRMRTAYNTLIQYKVQREAVLSGDIVRTA